MIKGIDVLPVDEVFREDAKSSVITYIEELAAKTWQTDTDSQDKHPHNLQDLPLTELRDLATDMEINDPTSLRSVIEWRNALADSLNFQAYEIRRGSPLYLAKALALVDAQYRRVEGSFAHTLNALTALWDQTPSADQSIYLEDKRNYEDIRRDSFAFRENAASHNLDLRDPKNKIADVALRRLELDAERSLYSSDFGKALRQANQHGFMQQRRLYELRANLAKSMLESGALGQEDYDEITRPSDSATEKTSSIV